jgi:hypothetical protein
VVTAERTACAAGGEFADANPLFKSQPGDGRRVDGWLFDTFNAKYAHHAERSPG